MKLPIYERDLDLVKSKYPKDWKSFYPRRIACPNGYVDPKYYSLVAWAGCFGIKWGPVTDTKVTALGTINQWMNFSCPTYFIEPEFAMAINATNPPEDITINDIHFPMESMLFVLPMKFIEATYKWMIPFICISRLPRGTATPNPDVLRVGNLKPGEIGCQAPMLTVHAPFFPKDGQGISYGGWYPSDMSIAEIGKTENDRFRDDAALQKEWYAKNISREFAEEFFKHDTPVPSGVEEQSIPTQFAMLGIKITLAMTARPALVSVGSQSREERVKKGVVVREALWSPNFVGKHYKIKHATGESLGGTHASPRVHWRMGHWHTVLYGKGRAMRRQDWFEPVLVNATQK